MENGGSNMDDRKKLIIGFGVACALLAVLLVVYLVSESFKGSFMVFSVVNVLALVLFAVLLIRDRMAAKRKGLPVVDELSKKITYRSGYFAWIMMMYTIIGFMVINVVLEETSPYYVTIDQALPLLVIISGLAFIFLMLLFKVRGIED
jgi:hypothetical protein